MVSIEESQVVDLKQFWSLTQITKLAIEILIAKAFNSLLIVDDP